MGPETRVPKIQIADVDLHIFFSLWRRKRRPQSLPSGDYHNDFINLGGWTETFDMFSPEALPR